MKALITGASSGIGADMARVMSSRGYDLILVARRKSRLDKLKKELKTKVKVIDMDISSTFNCMKLYNQVKDEKIDVIINNAGFGVFGEFTETNLNQELDMIDLNIKTVHTLTKLFVKDFKERGTGYILNVASSAAFLPGPLMASYYASKAYVLRLTEAVFKELKKDNSRVYIGVLCPGPTETEFNKIANVEFSLKSLNSYDVAQYAIKKMFAKKLVIIPGLVMKIGVFLTNFIPRFIKLDIAYQLQKRKFIK
ncbi:MAG: SDR family oxidoreductase [Bacilli bacterium]